MKIITTAAEKLINELKKSTVVVEFSKECIDGYPVWFFNSKKYEIREAPDREDKTRKLFIPFSIKINDEFISPMDFPFVEDPKYENYMNDLRDKVIFELENNINLRLGNWDILNYLENLEFNLKEIQHNYKLLEEYEFADNEEGYIKRARHIECNMSHIFENHNLETKHIGLSSDDDIPFMVTYDAYLYVDYALTRYWNKHFPVIERILKIIDAKKSIIEKTDDYAKVNSSITGEGVLKWTKTDTDLLELIISLFETGAIQNTTKNLTQKEAIQTFSDFFGIEIKDQYKKLNAARNRKKDDLGFINKMLKALEEYYHDLDFRTNI